MSSVTFRTQDNGSTALDSETVESLRSNLSGISLVSGDEGYDESRLIWNKSFDCNPGLIAFCKGVADVIECEINPLMITPTNAIAVDVLVRVAD